MMDEAGIWTALSTDLSAFAAIRDNSDRSNNLPSSDNSHPCDMLPGSPSTGAIDSTAAEFISSS